MRCHSVKQLVLIATITLSSAQYQSLSGYQVWALNGDIPNVSIHLLKNGLADILDFAGPRKQISIHPKNLEEVDRILNQEGIHHRVLIEDLAVYLESRDVLRKKRQTETCSLASCPKPLSESFMTFEEMCCKKSCNNIPPQMEWYLINLNATYYPRVEVTSIGKSIEGRNIWQVFIKSSACNEGTAIWLEGGIHAREWISPAVTLHLVNRLARDCSIGKLFDVYIVPMANPDGYEYTWNTNRLWRKNRRIIPDSDCDGVDLNRNWDFDYGVGASDAYCSEIYKGVSAFSEPETLSLKTAMEAVNQEKNLILVIALHSYGQYLLYPYGGRTESAPFTTEMIEKGKVFTRAVSHSHETVFRIDNSGVAYSQASGATDDWAKGVLGVKYVYTLELRDGGSEGFVLGVDKIAPSEEEIWEGMRAILLSVNPSNYTLL
ncbi:hypothetical protein SK128_012652 [Halocaridina rubra]|uniref:Peptidase M14 domain-containing protein n=1 Tax=Halocaridina rubra TaxID=373956 RepID=A0AAN8ZYJ2_HALRR